MESVITLLAKATVLCKTKRALAQRIGCSEQNLQGVINGRRHLTPGQVIALANLVGVSPLEVLAMDTIEREADPVERGRLQEGFFRRGTLGAAVVCLILATAGTPADAESSQARSLSDLTIYTLWRLFTWLRRAPVRPFGCVPAGAAAPAPALGLSAFCPA